MIDTIVIRFHDLKKHESIVNELKIIFNGTTKNTAYLSPDETKMIQNCETLDVKEFIKYFQDSDKSIHHIHYSNQKKMNSSGHYYLNIHINYDKDYIEFNFSIPKYIFGTNILMFCEHYWNKEFNFSLNSSLDVNLKRIYDRLIKFIVGFFKREFIDDKVIDYSLVEINRIDLSFNQVFDCTKSALDYLEYQKKIRKKYLSVNSNSFRAYDTSLMYTTERYSFKIYHKGTEYFKHDRKEHEKFNTEKGRDYFNIDELQSFADKMLRYEVTLRSSMLSYLFSHNVFRKKCPIHKARYEIYKKVESLKQKNDLIAANAKFFPEGIARDTYLKAHPYHLLDKNEEAIHNKMAPLLNKERKFFLKIGKAVEDFNAMTVSGVYIN